MGAIIGGIVFLVGIATGAILAYTLDKLAHIND